MNSLYKSVVSAVSKLHKQNKSRVMHPRKERYHLSFIGYSDKGRNLVKKKKKKCQQMPVRIKRAIHAASWFRHASLHTNQPSPGFSSHSLVWHSDTRWRHCQEFQLKYPFVISVQKIRATNQKKIKKHLPDYSIVLQKNRTKAAKILWTSYTSVT